MPDLINCLIRNGHAPQVHYVAGHWMDINDLHDLSRAGDFAHGRMPRMIQASDFIGPAKAFGFNTWAGVPCSFLTPFINGVIDDPDMSYVSASNEGDAVAIATGAALAGKRSVALMQNSGLGNAVSPLSSLNWVFRLPILLIITLARRARPAGRTPARTDGADHGQDPGRTADPLGLVSALAPVMSKAH